LIGDVHGHHQRYIDIASEAEYSIALGDIGFSYTLIEQSLDPDFHKIVAGNHDNYDIITSLPHYLGDFGIHLVPGIDPIFFIRGAWSIDQSMRSEGVSWWREEELSYGQCRKALERYEELKPKIVVSHECPLSVVEQMCKRKVLWSNGVIQTRTGQLLEQMIDAHSPECWMFGHYHNDLGFLHKETKFRCLDELSYHDIPLE